MLFEKHRYFGDCNVNERFANTSLRLPLVVERHNYERDQKMKNLTIRLETEKDYRITEELTREAFWNVYRPGCYEHYVLHTLRSDPDFIHELDFVMELDGRIIGHVMFMHAELTRSDGSVLPIMTFGPISIHPDFQRKGYGKKLLDFALDKARAIGAGAICIEGNINFYGKCGFTVASDRGLHYHNEPENAEVPYFLVCELKEGFLDGKGGTYCPPTGYFVSEADVEEFDKSFVPKQKLKLPGQLF